MGDKIDDRPLSLTEDLSINNTNTATNLSLLNILYTNIDRFEIPNSR
jgi:hypothetical protein